MFITHLCALRARKSAAGAHISGSSSSFSQFSSSPKLRVPLATLRTRKRANFSTELLTSKFGFAIFWSLPIFESPLGFLWYERFLVFSSSHKISAGHAAVA